ncbi:Cuticle protein [Folsomia candida]|uniref:Cuticle protein n=1 Tax=Folsomia candida TaxID=158441 RepID=A0A226E0N4_FOLCA|nr:Cuticle protein [Folsomia candida]
MGSGLKILVLTVGMISLGSCQYEQQVSPYTASRGGGPAYRAIPRLVGVKVGDDDGDEYLVGAEGRNVRITARPPVFYGGSGSGGSAGLADVGQGGPSPVSYAYVQQPGDPLPVVRRIRVNNNNPSPAATYASPATSPYQGVPVQYAHTVPAVATYRPAPVAAYSPAAQVSQQHHVTGQYRPVAYAPQPQYYAAAPAPQVAAAPRQKVVQLAPRPVLKAQKDDELTNYQNRQETRDGGVTKGSYSVVDPDGYVRTVTYEASSKGGFQAKVTREPTDVKIKFPVPTPAPEQTEGGKLRGQQPGQQLYQYAPTTPVQYATAGQYVPRRYPHRLAPQQYVQQ